MAFGKQEKEAIRDIVAKEIQDILRREFSDLKTQIQTTPERQKREPIKPKRVGRTNTSQYEHGAPGIGTASQEGASSGQATTQSQPSIGPTIPAFRGQSTGALPSRNDHSTVEQIASTLAKAQMELSEELNLNLQTLKDVIMQSQAIAQRIETLLGKDDSE